MKQVLLLALVLLAAACARTGAPSAASGRDCNRVVERSAAFTAPNASDTIEARAIGADCANAVVVWTVRNASGKPLWTHAAPYAWLHAPVDPTSRAEMETFLEKWAGVSVDDTSASPVWSLEDEAAPAAWGPRGSSMFVRETYETIRAAKLPRICVPTTSDTSECIFYDGEAEAVDVHYSGAV
jgi:hypothetical protein